MIIHLEQGEILFNETNMIVCETGDYENSDLVLVAELDNPEYPSDFPLYQYPAVYIKYGKYDIEGIDITDPTLS